MSNLIETIPFIGVRGDVKIETFDARSGEKKAETEGHNLFTNYGLERFRKMCAFSIGGQFGRNLYFDEADGNCESGATPNNAAFGFLKYLILTDNADAITAADSMIPGTLTGYATRDTYSGADITRGSLNRNESLFTKTGLKAVFDFATDRANGTHKSVFWSDFAPAVSNRLANLESVNDVSLARNYAQLAESDDGYFYGYVSAVLYKIDPITLKEISTYTLPAAPGAIFDVAGGYCYFTIGSSSTVLYVFNLSDSTSTTKTLPRASGVNGGAVIGGYLYYLSDSTKLYRFDLAVGTGTYNTISQNSNYTYRRGNILYYIDNAADQLYSYDFSSNTAAATDRYPQNVTRLCNTHSLTSAFWYKRQISSYYDGTPIVTINLLQKFDLTKGRGNMITGKVLDAPITKDATQTMKVTYTISFV